MSVFSIPPFTYSSSPGGMSGLFGRANTERSMRSTIGDVFSHDGQKGTHDYDFGSTTRLSLARTGMRVSRIDKSGVRLLGRNDPLNWACGVCGQPATLVCCARDNDSSPFVCAAHQKGHRCQDVAFLPVVNSPRMGVCAYEG
jgi:L-ascorbate metabolism protein UlaG (beta-lactamase superfamily)